MLLFLIFIMNNIQAQISGTVTENSGDEIIGATVFIEETKQGVITDFDGNYYLKDIQPGEYTVVFSYMGYETNKIDNVVFNGDTLKIDVILYESETVTDEVIVERKMLKNTESSVLSIKRKSSSLIDGISSDGISKSGDSDAASAIKRITGISVESGKYIYVRGLGDRYSKTTLNGSEIPGLDPNRNTIQMDLFPSNLLDNILVYKSFTPDLYGDFTGGYVDISTKDFPDVFTLNTSISLGYNTISTFNKNFLSSGRGRYDWIGFDDGSRQLPDVIRNLNTFPTYRPSSSFNFNQIEAQSLTDVTRSFSNNWGLTTNAPPLNQSINFSIGNKKDIFNRPFGFIFSMTYQRSFSGYQNGRYGIYNLPGQTSNNLITQMSLNDNKGTEDVIWGVVFGGGYKLNNSNRLGFTFLRNQSATSTTRFLNGVKGSDDPDDIFETRSLRFLQRSLTTTQLRGDHDFKKIEIKWQSSYSMSTQDEPDLRYFTNRIEPGGEADIKTSDNPPSRFYREMKQNNFSNRIDFKIPFKKESSFKFGLTHLNKSRSFRENRYVMTEVGVVYFDGNPSNYFSESNLINYDTDNLSTYDNGIVAQIGIDSANNYNAFQTVIGAYTMVDLFITDRIKLVSGIRLEKTNISLYSFDSDLRNNDTISLDGETKLLDNLDILPSISFNYNISSKLKLKTTYSRTLARPSFRELAPYTSFDVDGGYLMAGNYNLKRSLSDNFDLRFEFYPKFSEVISVGVFYKRFINPIERTFNPTAPNPEITFRNVSHANLVGLEFEIKKDFGFINSFMEQFKVSANFSYIYSQTRIDSLEYNEILSTDPNAKPYREMFGQSPFTTNASLSYINKYGTSANLVFNVSGSRISVIVRGGTPDVYTRPQPMINFNISQNIKKFKIKFSINNLLNTDYTETIKHNQRTYYVNSNPIGMSFSLGVGYSFSQKTN